MSRLALEGIRVVELSTHWAAPYAIKMLADMGAEVIKVEACQRPCVTRTMVLAENEPEERPQNRGGYFHKSNRNKYGVTINLNSPQGVEMVKKLVKLSDIIIDNFTPRVMKNFGLTYPVLSKINPGIIMASLTAYGQDGPYSNYGGFGATAESMGGLVTQTGYPGGAPRKVGPHYGDPVAGLMGAAAILIALHYRRKTGRGQYIDLSMQQSVLAMVGESIMDYTMNKREPQPEGNRHSSMAPHGCYRCKGNDKWIVITVSSDEEWHQFRTAIGNPLWTTEEKFSDVLNRWKNQDELDKLIEEWTVQHDHYEAMQILQSAGVPAGAVLTNKELLLDPHLKNRNFYTLITHPEVGTRPLAGMSFKLSKTPGNIRRSAPCLGEHNEYVFGELLGMSTKDMEQLAEEGIIGTEPIAWVPKYGEGFPLADWKKLGIFVASIDSNYREELEI